VDRMVADLEKQYVNLDLYTFVHICDLNT